MAKKICPVLEIAERERSRRGGDSKLPKQGKHGTSIFQCQGGTPQDASDKGPAFRGRYEIAITSSPISLRPHVPVSTLHRHGYFYLTAYLRTTAGTGGERSAATSPFHRGRQTARRAQPVGGGAGEVGGHCVRPTPRPTTRATARTRPLASGWRR